MRPLSSALVPYCRRALFNYSPDSWLNFASLSFRRHRSGGNSKKKPSHGHKFTEAHRSRSFAPSNGSGRANRHGPQKTPFKPFWEGPHVYKPPAIDPNNIPAFFEQEVLQWCENPNLYHRFLSFGIPEGEISPLVTAFVDAVRAGQLSTPECHQKYDLCRFFLHTREGDPTHAIDVIFSSIMFHWAAESEHSYLLHSAGVTPSTVKIIQALARAGARNFPAEDYPYARRMQRKIIMHVGPTNSGKTHNALRALAAAKHGVYAGPLRLLAHEIWERLNLGQIIPLGMEEEPLRPASIDTDAAADVRPVAKTGNPKYIRACNMITGEEQRIVEDHAPLLSCTVEMLKTMCEYDVAVIDEIQMISDEQRGSAWTTAVLGLCAKEIHLCGEETAIPVIQALLKDTGDEIIVNRYQRLTPLHVEEKSIEGDLSRVRKGDCIVTFSRGSIYRIKRRIETTTPLRCAVVYGRLPPEIRSEQAALFNDPNSGYDVIIGSDAIGMGLNLKIARIIFETTSKYDGSHEISLSTSQTKQIAGRAGRYGLHGADNPPGLVTAFSDKDLPHIRKALDALPVPLSSARIGVQKQSFLEFYLALPTNSSTATVLQAHQYISLMPAHLRQEALSKTMLSELCDFIDARANVFSIGDRKLLINAPVPFRDPIGMEIVQGFITEFQATMAVDFWRVLSGSRLMALLDKIEEHMKDKRPTVTSEMIQGLESLHKAVVFYLWMSFRRQLSWHCYREASELKERIEIALEWALQTITLTQSGRRKGQEVQQKTRSQAVPFKDHYGDVNRRFKLVDQNHIEHASPGPLA